MFGLNITEKSLELITDDIASNKYACLSLGSMFAILTPYSFCFFLLTLGDGSIDGSQRIGLGLGLTGSLRPAVS